MPISIRDVITSPDAPGGPLFPSGGKLADEVARIPGSVYSSRRDSLYGLLMQIFRGKRNCPPELEELIIQAIKRRLAGEPTQVVNHWVERLRQAVDYQSTKPDEVRPFVAEELFEEMLANAERAFVHFIINFRTVEEQGARGKAKSLQSILIRRLNLYKCDLVDAEPTTRYVFCLPGERTAQYFWRGLFQAVTKNNPVGEPLDEAKARQRICSLGSQLLQVWIVPEYMCGCPLLVFDPDDGPSAYSFCFHPNDRVSIMKWDADSISKWNMLVYTPFKHDLLIPQATLYEPDKII